ncbi:unnamed protein product [Lampetra fluviatilis]
MTKRQPKQQRRSGSGFLQGEKKKREMAFLASTDPSRLRLRLAADLLLCPPLCELCARYGSAKFSRVSGPKTLEHAAAS